MRGLGGAARPELPNRVLDVLDRERLVQHGPVGEFAADAVLAVAGDECEGNAARAQRLGNGIVLQRRRPRHDRLCRDRCRLRHPRGAASPPQAAAM